MENNYAERTGDSTIAIHFEADMGEIIMEDIYRMLTEYPKNGNCSAAQLRQKRILLKVATELETILPRAVD